MLLWQRWSSVRGVFVMQLLSAVTVTSLQTCSAEQELIEQLEKERERRRAEAYELQEATDRDTKGGDLRSLRSAARKSPRRDSTRRALSSPQKRAARVDPVD